MVYFIFESLSFLWIRLGSPGLLYLFLYYQLIINLKQRGGFTLKVALLKAGSKFL